MKTLVLWSGGPDCTSLLKHLLEATTREITAVHICSPNSVNRSEQELHAVRSIYPHLAAIRQFNLEVVDVRFPWDIVDAYVQITVLPALIYGTKCDTFYRGLCAEDLDPKTIARLGKFITNVWNFVDNREKWPTPTSMCPGYLPGTFDPDISNHIHLPKAAHLAYLGDLAELTWSCLSPVNGLPCNECRTCRIRHK